MSTNFTIRHFGIVVKNLDESLSFYKDMLEFDTFKEKNESGIEISTFLGIDNVQVKTIKMKDKLGKPSDSISSNELLSNDLIL